MIEKIVQILTVAALNKLHTELFLLFFHFLAKFENMINLQ